MRISLVYFAAASVLLAQPDPRALVRQSIANGEQAWERSRQYSYIKKDIERHFDSDGRVQSTGTDVYEIIPVNGDSFQMQVEHDGKPLPPDQERKQQRALKQRETESSEQAAKRFEQEKRDREFYREIPEAFDFRITGEEILPTGPAWVLEATPRPGFQPKSRYTRMFPKMRGKLWIDERDVQWVKADAVAVDDVTFGYFIARLSKGSHIILEQTRLPDDTWVPKRIKAKASARTFLLFSHNFEEDITYSNFRKGAPVNAARQENTAAQ